MAFARGKSRPANSGRRKGSRNKSTLAGAPKTYPDALEHLAKVMTSADGTITPDLKLRAAVALAVPALEANACARWNPHRSDSLHGAEDR
jgi:hypothetical protein